MDSKKKRQTKPRDAQRVSPVRRGEPRLRPSDSYRYFDVVARHGSIRKAAEILHIASSALNRRILDLEQEVGLPLFDRLPRGVRPTAAGELLLAYVRRSLKDLHRLEAQIDQLRGQTRGIVRIAVAESVTPSLLPHAIATYQETHPGVSFHVMVDGPEVLMQALVSDDVDLILTHVTPEKPTVSVLAATTHPLCALVVPDHPLAGRSPLHLSDCAAFPLAMPDQTLAARMLLDLAAEEASLPLMPAVESDSIETLKAYARLGKAICFSFHLGGEAETEGLTALALGDARCRDARLYLAARRGRVLPVAPAVFAEQLTETLCAGPPGQTVSAV